MNIMCRTLLQGTLAAGAARRTGAVESPAPILRAIAATGERIPVVGIGSNAYDVESAEDLAARRAVLRKFPVLGGSLIDTARVAGQAAAGVGEGIRCDHLGAVHAQVQPVAIRRSRR